MKKLICTLSGLVFLCGNSLLADVTYTYTGNDFTFISAAPYTTSDFVSGSVTFAAPLPDNLAFTIEIPTAYSLTDGHQTFTEANSILVSSDFATGASGAITDWQFGVTGPGHVGSIDVLSGGDVANLGPDGTPTAFALNSSSGVWTGPSIASVPESSSLLLLGLAFLMLAVPVSLRNRHAMHRGDVQSQMAQH